MSQYLDDFINSYDKEHVEKVSQDIESRVSRRQFVKQITPEKAAEIEEKRNSIAKNRIMEMEDLLHKCVICNKQISLRTIISNAYIIDNNGNPTSGLKSIDSYVKVCSEECRKEAIYSIYPSDEEILSIIRTDGVYLDIDEKTECNIPSVLRKFNKNFYLEEQKHFIEEWVNDFKNKKSKWFVGTPGCGKTGLAISYLCEMRRREHKGYFIKFYDLAEELNRIKIGFSGKVIKKYTQYDILIIDDISELYLTDYSKSVLFNLFNNLYENNSKVIFTSNYSLESISNWIDGRLFSRFNNYLDLITFDGIDIRSI